MRWIQFASYLLPIVAAMLAAPVIVGTARAQASTACEADFTGDGVVNFGDLAVFKSVFFQRCNDPGPTCGDDLAQGPAEQCDDGNLLDGDGCSSSCMIESPLPVNRLLATGQKNCWNNTAEVVSCVGTGQDGDLQKGTPLAYVDNRDGTITDSNTGLIWEKLSDDGSIHDWDNRYTWLDAFAVKIATLNAGGGFAGATDWRVPNIRELRSIVDFRKSNPSVSPAFNTGCVPGVTVLDGSCTQKPYHWSSTAYEWDPYYAFNVGFFSGISQVEDKDDSLYVRAVRGGL